MSARPLVVCNSMKLRFHGKLWVIGCVMILASAMVGYAQPKRASAPQFRSITVITQPKSSVWIDGVLYGKTDDSGKFAIMTVSSGSHTIRVRSDGFHEKSQPLTALQKGDVSIPLVKTTDAAELAFQEAERLTTVDREKAAAAYKKAVKLRPAYPEAFLGLARVLSDSGALEEAMNAIMSARKLRPGYAEASAVEARIHKDLNEEGNAIVTFKRSITEGKGFQPEALTGLGIIYKDKAEGFGGSGDFEQETSNYLEAAKYFRSAINQLSGAPDSVVVYQLLGLIYERQKKYDEAIAIYEEFLRLYPDSPETTAIRSFIEQIKKQRAN